MGSDKLVTGVQGDMDPTGISPTRLQDAQHIWIWSSSPRVPQAKGLSYQHQELLFAKTVLKEKKKILITIYFFGTEGGFTAPCGIQHTGNVALTGEMVKRERLSTLIRGT